jgi:probable rRNA maturation factor
MQLADCLRILKSMPSQSKVYFFFNTVRLNLNNRAQLKKQIEAIFREERKPLQSINYVFCSDSELLRINQEYLGHDYYTDIITFDLSEGPKICAEIYISVDRVKENAVDTRNFFKTELQRVMYHGALHLCGYSDKTQSAKRLMRKKEDHYLHKFSESKSVSRGTFKKP